MKDYFTENLAEGKRISSRRTCRELGVERGDLACEIAATFGARLWAELTPRKRKAVILRNRKEVHPVCHSHDFLDANETMSAAFEYAVGRKADVSSDADCALWNAAWDLAKAHEFTASAGFLCACVRS